MSDNYYYGLLSIGSSVCSVSGYLPEIYGMIMNKTIVVTRGTWLIWMLANLFGIAYGVVIDNNFIIMNNSINLGLNIVVFNLKQRQLRNTATRVENDILM